MPLFPTTETTLILPGPAGDLEVLTTPAKEPTEISKKTAIICHPHPLFGGTMHNKVVSTLARAFTNLGLQTVRFNFRGVGNTSGQYAEGIGETDDLIAIMNWVKETCPNDEIWLAGFSFGSYVAARAASQVAVGRLISIAPPVSRFDLVGLSAITCPWLIVQGGKDEIVVPEEVYAWVEKLNPKPVFIRMPEAGHFFHGQLMELRKIIEDTLT